MVTKIGKQRWQEQYDSLKQMNDRDLCEMIRAHFTSHPCLPGERSFKNAVNQHLDTNESDFVLSPEEKESYAKAFADTRIRETKLNKPPHAQRSIQEVWRLAKDQTSMSCVVPVTLCRSASGGVSVFTTMNDVFDNDFPLAYLGDLPDSFVKNNPMMIKECGAELEITDYSNGWGESVRTVLIVDSDRMSGNVINLEENNTSLTQWKLNAKSAQFESLRQMNDRDLCEMIRAHFASHPCLPGEQKFKDEVNQLLNENDSDFTLSPKAKTKYAMYYAGTRIRETRLDAFMADNQAVRDIWESVSDKRKLNEGHRIDVDLCLTPSGKVSVILPKEGLISGQKLGELPAAFLANNPMNVNRCEAKLEIAACDQGGKNLTATIVADTDLMSGDVIDLEAEDLASLSKSYDLEQ